MRMFFSKIRPKEETIAILERFHMNCQKALDKLNTINQEFEQCDIRQTELLYSKTTLYYGEKYY